jgi:tetratricopeptide (TPR) repeat protein
MAGRAKGSGRRQRRPATSFIVASRSTPVEQFPFLSPPKIAEPTDLVSSRHTYLALSGLSGSEWMLARLGKSDDHENARETEQFRPRKWLVALVAVAMAIPWVVFQKLADTAGGQIVGPKPISSESASVVTGQAEEILPASAEPKRPRDDLTNGLISGPTPREALPDRLLDKEELAKLLRRGRYLLSIGDIASARALFERAADARDASAAFHLAETYDPMVLTRYNVFGAAPDLAMARAWYEKALNLGHSEAQQCLSQLQK